jgi:hypothetical protein
LLVDHRPDFDDLPIVEPVEDVLRKRDSSTCGLESQKGLLGSALEEEPAGYEVVVGNQDLGNELEVLYGTGVGLEHRSIAAEAQLASVVHDVIGHESSEFVPPSVVQASQVVAVDPEQIAVLHQSSDSSTSSVV